MFDGSHDQYVGENLVPGRGSEGKLWQSLIAEDVGLLATAIFPNKSINEKKISPP